MVQEKKIVFTEHARQKMADRGATEEEVIMAIRDGQREPALFDRHIFRMNFDFHARWQDKTYAVKQVAPIVAEEADSLVVVTVYVFYF